jgi:hypothetical protein
MAASYWNQRAAPKAGKRPQPVEAYDVDVMFDRQSRDRTVLRLTLAEALPKIWTMTPEPRAILENQDVIELDGEAWKAHSRFVRRDGLVEHELYLEHER